MVLSEITFDLSRITGLSIMISVVGYLVVFVALVVLVWIFNLMPWLIKINVRRQLRAKGKSDDHEISNIEGNISAAIASALYLHFSDIHDDESGVITIKRISKQYTPWSSKIYSTNSFFRLAKR